MTKNWIIFGLSNSFEFAKSIGEKINVQYEQMHTSIFADGEMLVKSPVPVRGKDVILIQSTSKPVNDNLMELLIAIDALKRASANSIIVLIPYFGYARQDRKTQGREPITCKLVADFIVHAGATKVILVDIHSKQTQGFFNVPVDTLVTTPIMIDAYKKNNKNDKDFCVVAPDYGAVKKVRDIAEHLYVPFAIIDKRRPKPNVVEVSNILGDVKDKVCLLIDDMIDTGGTILAAAKLLKKHQAKKIVVMVTHGIFSRNAIDQFKKAIDENIISELYVTNTIKENSEIEYKGIHILDLSTFLAEILEAQIKHLSVSKIYKRYWENACMKK